MSLLNWVSLYDDHTRTSEDIPTIVQLESKYANPVHELINPAACATKRIWDGHILANRNVSESMVFSILVSSGLFILLTFYFHCVRAVFIDLATCFVYHTMLSVLYSIM